ADSANNFYALSIAGQLWKLDFQPGSGDLGDTLDGGAGADQLFGDGGDDTLIGGAAGDKLDGGLGLDTASYATATSGVYVFFGDLGHATGDAIGDTFSSIENMTGSAFSDVLGMGDDANVINGGAGADQLYGQGGDDTLIGGAGADALV